MRVMMVQTPSVEGASSERVYPIGIVALSTRLRTAGHEVKVIDMNKEEDSFGMLKGRLLEFSPEVVCLSLRNIDPLANKTFSLVPLFLTTVRLVSSVLPGAWIVAGGTGFSLFPRRLMSLAPDIDYGIVGEAELTLAKLFSSIENPDQLNGLYIRKGDRLHLTSRPELPEMEDYLIPDRRLLDPAPYLKINSYAPAIGVEAKRGCNFNCAYCVYPELQGRRVRCRSPLNVVDEIELLIKEYGIERIHFTDPIVNFPQDHLEEICREIIRRKMRVRWDGFMREDLITEENISLYERSGCECFSFSPDGLCQESLNVLNKRLTVSDILRTAGIASRTDVISVYHFMVNVPGETEETAVRGMKLLDRLYEIYSRKRNLGTIVLNNIRILPGTGIERIAMRSGVIGDETDLLYPVYYNPKPFDTLRYRLEAHHLCRNVFMWQEVC